jgi:hypothetical protein
MNSATRVLERARRVSGPSDDGIATVKQAASLEQASATALATDAQERAARRIREWLLFLLRFAVTSEPADRSVALALADEIDAVGLHWRPSAPTFFRRTTGEVCDAITAVDDPKRTAVLKQHIARIDNPALRRAFQAAVNMERRSDNSVKRERTGLWSGLQR